MSGATARDEFGAELLTAARGCSSRIQHRQEHHCQDAIADAMLQQILLRPAEYDVIATPNLNGDYLSDALVAEVGGIGIAPGANLSDSVAMFSHPRYRPVRRSGQGEPGSLILSAEMMLRHGLGEAADLIIMRGACTRPLPTTERLMDGAKLRKCSSSVTMIAAVSIWLNDCRIHAGIASVSECPIQQEERAASYSAAAGVTGFRFAYRLTQRLDVDGMQTLGALNDLELHRLSGLERAISIHLDGRIMGEEVFVTSFRDDEAIPLGIIEPFDLADLHAAFLCCPQT